MEKDRTTELFDQAGAFFRQGRLEEAADNLQAFLEEQPGNPTALRNLTAILLRQGLVLEDSQRGTLRWIQRDYERAHELYSRQEYEECREVLEQVLSLCDDFPAAEHYTVPSADMIDEISLELEVRENNRQIGILFDEGKELFDRGLFVECIEKMMSILSIDPGHEESVRYITEATKRKK